MSFFLDYKEMKTNFKDKTVLDIGMCIFLDLGKDA